MHIDIFKGDAFEVASLTTAIEKTPYEPGRISELKLFKEEPISTTTVSVEQRDNVIQIVPAAPRGSSGKPYANDKRKMIPFSTTHLPQRGAILADEVQNLRAFGKESDTELASAVMNRKLATMRRDMDVTHEWQRMGAIKGQVLDADGTTVLLDLFSAFGVSQQSKIMALGTGTTNVKQKIVEAKRLSANELGGLRSKGYLALCSSSFFDAFVGHDSVAKAFDRWQEGSFFRADQSAEGDEGFPFVGVQWEEYKGAVGGTQFVEDGAAYLVPLGVSELFKTHYAPADYMETVNTLGLPYYAKRKMMDFDKGVDIEAQSNPLHMCTRPRTVIKLTIS